MNNYSFLQKKLHLFALSSKYLREAFFDFEQVTTKTKSFEDNHVFVVGLARSGTTAVLNAIYQSNEFASLSYQDMPFILSPNLWKALSFSKKQTNLKERAHGDGIFINSSSPEAFEEVFWKTFDDKSIESHTKFKSYVNLIINKYNKSRYLSKNNQNIKRINIVSSIFPKSKILIPFRDPIQHAFSLLSQHKKFINENDKDKFVGQYMKLIGHTEFGPNYRPLFSKESLYSDPFLINHWLEQWYFTYLHCLENYSGYRNISFLCYEDLCRSSEIWQELLIFLNIDVNYIFKFRESCKEIDFKIEKNLQKKCVELYQLLKLNSFNNG